MSKSSKVEKEFNLADWDHVKFVKNELRRSFKRSPMFYAAKARYKEEYFVEAKNGNMMRRVHFRCAGCGRYFKDEGGTIAVDHIDPIEPLDGSEISLDEYIQRLYCIGKGLDGLQILCNYPKTKMVDGVQSCHKLKTAAENAERKANKKKRTKK